MLSMPLVERFYTLYVNGVSITLQHGHLVGSSSSSSSRRRRRRRRRCAGADGGAAAARW